MTDRELLDQAAKALGCVHIDEAKRLGTELVTADDAWAPFWMVDGKHCSHWNPLENDGDALRLAVNLGLVVVPEKGVDSVEATRRVIVLAAATLAAAHTQEKATASDKLNEAAEKRIAELEVREVKLPKPISVLHRRDFNDAHRSIYAYPEAEVNAALAAAGIRVKGDSE